MSPARFIKRYRSPAEVDTALAHYRWLLSLGADVGLPRLLEHTPWTLEFEHVSGRAAELGDLPAVASALGRLHHTARQRGLAQAMANSRYITSDVILDAFAGPRRRRLHELCAVQGAGAPLSHEAIGAWLDHAAMLPVALYKDANPRNVLVADYREPVLVDFDSLTLAPVGYDLAKLLVTTAMTGGDLPPRVVEETITAYAQELPDTLDHSRRTELTVWAEFHHLLTLPYLGHHGYRYPWPAVRPWPAGEVHDAAGTAERNL
ncbi:phosphotransferase [Haloactinomyces albus]|uniref:Aminoglycoside phosphotransferase domain-containing protein n=1 Tax=Haloactinomyces albus TaxID=1352928 RepID=A0AAE3ZIK7_9ACTN|nr:phosphotransferase [Haloactinomyces albus]MDR7303877.1 hypothetical protein [Haloactinomyces albus]